MLSNHTSGGSAAAVFLTAHRHHSESSMSVNHDHLFMVEHPDDLRSGTSMLWSVDELQPGGTVKHTIPFRYACGITQFQGQSVKPNCYLSLFTHVLCALIFSKRMFKA